MRLFKWLAMTVSVLFVMSAHAATPSDDLKSLLNGVKTMQAAFTQTVYDNREKPVETSYGKMSMERPGKFRWEVTKPIPQLIIANQSKLWIYDPDLEQVTIRKLEKATGDTPALLLSHVDAEIDKSYTITTAPTEANIQWFKLVPKNKDSMFEQVKLGFAKQQIQQMRLQDHLGHTTQIKFSNITTNNNLAATLFTFKPPKNTDVIDETNR